REPDARTIELRDAALAVSCPEPPGNRGHIVDPRTGCVVTGTRRVAVVGPAARHADAWATALAVTGERLCAPGHEWIVIFH
ncbi:MAG: FAD:protein FMN transferase, partial [Longimicrobiales bacterium]